MSDESWHRELARVNREMEAEERDRLDDRWDRLSRGELSPEEEAGLRALAETSEEARQAWEAFRPLGADFQARVVRSIQGEITAVKPPAKTLPFRKRPSWIAAWSAAAAVAAAALFLLVRGPASSPPLPVYAAELTGGDQEYRGGTEPAAGVPVFSPGSILRLDAFPEEAVNGPVEARAFAARGAEWVKLESPAGDGSKRLEGTIGKDLQLAPGVWRLWIVVGRPGKIPALRELKAELAAGRTRHEDWQAVSGEIRVEERQAGP